jgi:hypothetical protein
MIDTREADALDKQPPLEISGLEQYAEGTSSQARPSALHGGTVEATMYCALLRSCSAQGF